MRMDPDGAKQKNVTYIDDAEFGVEPTVNDLKLKITEKLQQSISIHLQPDDFCLRVGAYTKIVDHGYKSPEKMKQEEERERRWEETERDSKKEEEKRERQRAQQEKAMIAKEMIRDIHEGKLKESMETTARWDHRRTLWFKPGSAGRPSEMGGFSDVSKLYLANDIGFDKMKEHLQTFDFEISVSETNGGAYHFRKRNKS